MTTLYMDAEIKPHRSLSKQGFRWVFGAIIAFNLITGCFFLFALHAFPVPIFLGLDVLGVFLAFRLNYSGAGQIERVQISAREVRVLHQYGRRARTVWTSPTAFTRVKLDDAGEHNSRVSMHLSGRSVIVGVALSPGERDELAAALEAAIKQARMERG
jgi:uncharacterized membrane protein